MPKPTSKKELLEQSNLNYSKLMELVDSYSKTDQKREFSKGTLNRNIRDVLTHLHHWHLLFLNWHSTAKNGLKPDMPAKGYTWKTMPDLNRKIWEDCQSIKLSSAKIMFKDTHLKVVEIINQHSNKELFTKKKYTWTGSTSLAAYLIANCSSHYVWAFKLIRKSLK